MLEDYHTLFIIVSNYSAVVGICRVFQKDLKDKNPFP